MVERAFRCLKTVDLHVRPIYHWLEDRVRAHVFLCMLAYYVEWHLRARLAPMLYDDDDKAAAEALRDSPVAKAQRSPTALAKSATGRTADGAPVHSFQSLLADLATLARNTIVTAIAPDRPFTILTRPTPIQQKAFDLLGIPHRLYPVAANPETARRERDTSGSTPCEWRSRTLRQHSTPACCAAAFGPWRSQGEFAGVSISRINPSVTFAAYVCASWRGSTHDKHGRKSQAIAFAPLSSASNASTKRSRR